METAQLRDKMSKPPEYDARVLATTSTFLVKQFGTYTFGSVSEICRDIRLFSMLRILHNQCFGSEDICTFVPTWSTASILIGSLMMLVVTPAVLVLLVSPSFGFVPPQTLVFHFPSWPSFPSPLLFHSFLLVTFMSLMKQIWTRSICLLQPACSHSDQTISQIRFIIPWLSTRRNEIVQWWLDGTIYLFKSTLRPSIHNWLM